MDVYLVGGAVRDELLGRPNPERDWVVVNGSAEALLAQGYRQVGRDFPVFLHPETHEEYALARTERKTGPGHQGFECHTGPDVTLEEDLERRDLTVNAMARGPDGRLIDPFGGRRDLEQRLLRHVSPAFAEDPLRVFRVARFAAELHGFSVAEETMALMSRIADGGELAELSAERVWVELAKALAAPEPLRFFTVLRSADALHPWLVEFEDMEVLLPESLTDPVLRFAALGWLLTAAEAGTLCGRLKAPNEHARPMLRVAQHGGALARWRNVKPAEVLQALKGCNAFHRDGGHEPVVAVVSACAHVDLTRLCTLVGELNREVTAADLPAGLSGPAVGEALDAARSERIAAAQRGGG